MNLPFVIYTPARTGSTTLMKLVNCHPGIKCLFEPFNTGNVSQLASRLQVVQQTRGLAAAVGTLWAVCNGFKHVWHNDGWPFVSEPELNYQILLLPGVSIVLLSRRNLLRRAISVQISDQMKVWVPWNEQQRKTVKEHVRGELDIGRLREEMEGEKMEEARVHEKLTGSGKAWKEVFYEDFFAAGLTMDQRVEAVQAIFDFLAVGRVSEPARLAAMRELFDPAISGFQNDQWYAKIPNIQEVERELGCEDTGFIFDETPRQQHPLKHEEG